MYRPSNQTAKKFARLAGLLILSGGLLASCDGYSFITDVQVKADPQYTIPTGEKTVNLLEMEDTGFDITQTLADIGASMGGTASLYRTSDTDEEMKILLHMPIAEVPLDFQSYLGDMDFTTELVQSLEEQSFTIPEITFPSTTIPGAGAGTSFDINDQILSSLNSGMQEISIDIAEPDDNGPLNVSQTVDLATSGYTEVTFASGFLEIPMELTTSSTDFTITISSVELISGGATVSSDNTGYTLSLASPNATISIPLAGVTLDNSPEIRLTMNATGGTLSLSSNINGTPGFSATTAVDAVSGLSFNEEISINNTLPLGETSAFVSALIGTGSIDLSGDPIPSSWSGFTQTLNLGITQTDGLNIAAADYDPANDRIILDGQALSSADITIAGTLTISADNANLTGLQSSTFEPSYTLDGGIESFTSIRVAMAEGFAPTLSSNQDMASMAEWVSSITFTKVGVAVGITNGLPVGNDITVTVNSTALEIDSTHTYAGAGPGATEDIQEFVSSNLTLSPLPANLDFEATIGLAGYNSGDNTLTLNNIETGTSYTFGGDVSAIADWESANITAPAGTGIEGTFPDDGSGMNLSELGEFLPEGVDFAEIPVYLYMNGAPEGLNPNISLSATYTGITQDPPLLTNATITNALLPNLTPDAANTDFITLAATTLSTDSISDYLEEPSDPPRTRPNLSGILKDKPDDLVIDYNLGISEVTLYSADMGEVVNITADLIIVVPASFTVPDEGVPVTAINDMIVIESDVLGRTFPSTGDEEFGIETALDFLTGISVNIDYVNNTGIRLEARVKAYPDTADPPNYAINKSRNLETGADSMVIALTTEELALVQEGPFIPEIELWIPVGTHTLSNNPEITLTPSITVNSDIDYSIDLGSIGEGN